MPTTKPKKREFNWVGVFQGVWLIPMVVGIVTTILKLCGAIQISWLLAVSPIIFSYVFFAAVLLYVAFFQEKIEKIFKKNNI